MHHGKDGCPSSESLYYRVLYCLTKTKALAIKIDRNIPAQRVMRGWTG